MKFRVLLRATQHSSGVIEVEADSPEGAVQVAIEKQDDCPFEKDPDVEVEGEVIE